MSVWKKLGWIGLAVLAVASCVVLQLGLGMLCMLPASVMAAAEAAGQGITDIAQIQDMSMKAMMDMAPWGVLLYHVVSLPVFGLWYYFGCGRPKPARIGRVLRPKSILAVMVAGFGMCFMSNGLVALMQYIAPKVVERYTELMEIAGLGVTVPAIIASVILAPIGEELLCRGIILHYGRKVTQGMANRRLAFWIANTIQAFFFGVIHGNLLQGSYAFLIGLILGWMCERYKSLYPAILGHFMVNFLSSFVMIYLLAPLPEGILTAIGVTVFGIAVLSAAYAISRDKNMAGGGTQAA